jgi:protein-L-isoaspartate(D-aspartate) O-methyltransferase
MHVTMNLEQARFNMIEQQIRSSEPLREDVRELLHLIRRDDFAPSAARHLAFADIAIPLGHGAAMLTPRVEAAAVQALSQRKHETVLEIGTGSGYLAALLAVHADRVVSIEIVPQLADFARSNLHRASVGNVRVETGDGLASGLHEGEQFDVIMLGGGVGRVPEGLLARLKIGGRLLAFVGEAPVQTAHLFTRVGETAWRNRGLFETFVAPLRNAPSDAGFVL